jgi:hypothetical protein
MKFDNLVESILKETSQEPTEGLWVVTWHTKQGKLIKKFEFDFYGDVKKCQHEGVDAGYRVEIHQIYPRTH